MRYRLTVPVALFVAAVHGWVLFGPSWGNSFPQWVPPDPAPSVQAVWVHLPRVEPVAATPAPQQPKSEPKPKPKPKPKSAPKPAPAPTEPQESLSSAEQLSTEKQEPFVPEDTSLALPLERTAPLADLSDTVEPDAGDAAPAAPAESTPDTPPPPSGPRLQVRDSAGAAINVVLPADGSALSNAMLLRFAVHGFVKGMQYHANAELEWHTEGDSYRARQSISAFLLGSMEQTSSGRLTAQGLQPMQFTDRRFAKRRSVHFDWDAQQATFDPAREPAPIGPGAQDRLSVFLQLAAMLQAMPDLRTPGTRIDIPTLGSRHLQIWTFTVKETESLDLPSGPMTALRLQRQLQAGDDEQAMLWVNPAQGYVPVRIHMQERNGDVMDLSLKP